ncbi:MarR family winged helix-turn-helix transcriptional regulator [Gilvibacter sediminis]|uniref:MarR family winged helix-turn-helix transcriptional regulator n=1 Tax=Gilvibacter sediminis TaxID=379071 RepID=UPI002350C716|nr:MarR family winged helix-turn-helix transcriptional regulator [Gilvibacter sediminis]MDC7997864.1 MarR family winged helix-turn-helix transcriptional regulator [Gilvibacter sediminis]
MAKSRFKPEHQNSDLNLKVVSGLERLGESFRHLLWDQAKTHGISPIQIQILLFCSNHDSNYNTVSYLALEFNVTKATISDAVRVLVNKELLQKIPSASDQRSYWLKPTPVALQKLESIASFDKEISKEVNDLGPEKSKIVFEAISQMIFGLHKKGIIKVQRQCQACKFFDQNKDTYYCQLLEMPLKTEDLRLDCPEFETQ